MAKLMTCRCVSEYQDRLYGQSMRVHNPTAKETGWSCTVCDDTKAGQHEKVLRSAPSGAVPGV
jgi:predicted transcriptional regulator